MSIKPLIAVVEDDNSVREATVGLLRSNGFIAKGFPSADEFLKSSRVRITSCLIADVQMPKMSGLALYGKLVALGSPIPTVHNRLSTRLRARAISAGVTGYLSKPFSEKELLDCVDAAFKRNALLAPLKR